MPTGMADQDHEGSLTLNRRSTWGLSGALGCHFLAPQPRSRRLTFTPNLGRNVKVGSGTTG